MRAAASIAKVEHVCVCVHDCVWVWRCECDCVGVGVIVCEYVGVIAWVRKGVYGWDSLACCSKVCVK